MKLEYAFLSASKIPLSKLVHKKIELFILASSTVWSIIFLRIFRLPLLEIF